MRTLRSNKLEVVSYMIMNNGCLKSDKKKWFENTHIVLVKSPTNNEGADSSLNAGNQMAISINNQFQEKSWGCTASETFAPRILFGCYL